MHFCLGVSLVSKVSKVVKMEKISFTTFETLDTKDAPKLHRLALSTIKHEKRLTARNHCRRSQSTAH